MQSPAREEPQVPDRPQRGGTLVVAYSSDIPGINELAVSSSQTTTEILNLLYCHLLDEQPDYKDHPPTFRPRLAESYEFSSDRKTLTFKLRKGVTWSDGVALTADDVRWTWQAQTHPGVAWDSVGMKSSIVDVEVVDAHTVRFHFTHAYPGQLVHANEGGILPKHAWNAIPFEQWRNSGDWFREHMVVSGPFTLDRWKRQEEIVLARNPRYFEPGLPYLDRVIFRVIPDPANQLTQFLSGSIDYIRQLPAAQAAEIARLDDKRLLTFWPAQFTSILWNLRSPLFAEVDVRRALAHAIDRQTIVDALWYQWAQVANSPIISSVWGHNRNLPQRPFDPNEAQRLLATAGWRDTDGDGVLDKDGLHFSFELLVNDGNQERVDAAIMIQDQLRRVGIEVRPLVLEWNLLDSRMTGGEFGAVIIGLGLETSLDVSAYFHTDSISTEMNFGGYTNPEVDRLLDSIRSQIRLEDAQPYLDRLQEVLDEEQPQTILWESQRLVGLSRRLQGATPNAISTLDGLERWWLAPSR